jgi:GT2 family glycosyltransferase
MNISLILGIKNNLEYTKHFYTTTRQLYPNIEICFASYASIDGTNEWLDSLTDENVKFFHSPETKTFSDTFNKAAELATKDYVMFLHNDIVLAPNFLENIEKHLNENSVVSYTTIEPPIFAGHERPGKIIKDFGTDINTLQLNEMYKFVDMQREVYRDKTEQGITFFMCMPKSKYLQIGGLHNIFNPMFCEDDDLILRWKLLGLNLFTSLDAICYHFVSKTSRFSKEYLNRTQQIEQHSNKNFIRKWGFRNSKYNKKYNTAFIIHNCNLQGLEALEPWCDRIYINNDNVINEYINSDSKNTSFDLTKRVLNINKNEPYSENDIIVEFNIQHFNQNSFNIIQNLSDIISESGTIGQFELDCFNITIHQIKDYSNELIYLSDNNR